jgi:TP901 family phage tail tape measure protein
MNNTALEIAVKFNLSGLANLMKAAIGTKEFGLAIKNTVVDMKKYNKEMQILANNMEKLDALKEQRDYAILKLTKLKSLAANNMVTSSIKAAMSMEESMAAIGKVVDFTGKEEKELFERRIRHLTQDIPASATDLAAIAVAGGQMGIAKEKLIDFTELAAKAATAFGIGTQEMGQSVGKLMSTYKLGIDETKSLLDATSFLAGDVSVNAADITETLQKIGGSAKVFGLAAEEAAALSTAMLSLGESPDVAGAAINRLLSALAIAPKQGKPFQDALNNIGLDAKQLKETIEANPKVALTDFLQRLEQIDKGDRTGIFTDIIGQEFADDLAVLVGGLDRYKKAMGDVADKNSYQNSIQREFEEQAALTSAEIIKLKNSFVNIGQLLGNTLLPTISFFARLMASAANCVSNFIEDNKLLATILTHLAAGFIALRAAMLTFRAVQAALKILSLQSIIAGQKATLVTLAEGRAVQVNTWAKLKNAAAARGMALANIFSVGKSKLAAGATALFSGSLFKFGGVFTRLGGIVKIVARGIGFAIRSIPIIGWIALAVDCITLLADKFGGFGNLMGIVWDGIKKVFEWSPFGLISKVWGVALEWLGEKFEWVNGLTEYFSGIMEKVGGFFSKIGGWLGFGGDESTDEAVGAISEASEVYSSSDYNLSGAPVAVGQMVGGGTVNINFSGDFTIGMNQNGTFNFSDFKNQLVAAVKDSLKTDAQNANNRRLS